MKFLFIILATIVVFGIIYCMFSKRTMQITENPDDTANPYHDKHSTLKSWLIRTKNAFTKSEPKPENIYSDQATELDSKINKKRTRR